MVVVQVWRRFRRTILRGELRRPGGGAAVSASAAAQQRNRGGRSQEIPAVHFTLLEATRSFAQCASSEVVDADHRSLVRGGVDEFAVAHVDAGVGDLLVGRCRSRAGRPAATARGRPRTCRSQSACGCASRGSEYAAAAAQHLREAGAIVAVAGRAAPGVGQGRGSACSARSSRGCRGAGYRSEIAALHPSGAVVGQADLEPAAAFSSGSATTSRRVSKGTVSKGAWR